VEIKILSNIIMPKFHSGKITTNVLFYDRGVPPSQQYFAWAASQNYSMLKQISRFYKANK
jgi:hypothetical protein